MKIKIPLIVLAVSILFIACDNSLSKETGSVSVDAGAVVESAGRQAINKIFFEKKGDDFGGDFGGGKGMGEIPPEALPKVTAELVVRISTEGDYTETAEESYSLDFNFDDFYYDDNYEKGPDDKGPEEKNPDSFEFVDPYQELLKRISSTPVTIDNIPVGNNIRVLAEILNRMSVDYTPYIEWIKSQFPEITDEELKIMIEAAGVIDDGMEDVMLYGYSEYFLVQTGTNPIRIKMVYSYMDDGDNGKDGKGKEGKGETDGHGDDGRGKEEHDGAEEGHGGIDDGHGKEEHGGEGGQGGGGEPTPVHLDIPVILWNSRTTETTLIRDENNPNTKVGTKTEGSFTEGAQYFSYAETGMKVSSPDLPSNVYCYGDDCIYAVNTTYDGQNELTAATIEKYIYSGSGYIKDNTFTDIDVMTLFNNSDISSNGTYPLANVQSIAYAELNGHGYFFVGFLETDPTHPGMVLTGCFAVDPSDTSKIYGTDPNSERFSSFIPAIIARSNGSSIDLYYAQQNEDFELVIQTVHVTAFGNETYADYMIDGSNKASVSTLINITSEATNLGISPQTLIGDLKLVGNTLYVALYAYTEGYTSFYFETDDTVSEPNGKPLIISNGGIAKIADITAATPEFTDWSNGEKVLGWFKGDYYTGVYTRAAAHDTIYPPLALADKYFYGARKFISNSTEKLVIADDGAIILGESEELDSPYMATISSTNMNRVVVVDPSSGEMTVIDVDAAFDASAYLGSLDFGIADGPMMTP